MTVIEAIDKLGKEVEQLDPKGPLTVEQGRQLTPAPTPEQAVHMLEILEQWTKRGWKYSAYQWSHAIVQVEYTDPDHPDEDRPHLTRGMGLFDALCQATTVMQVLLEEHPEKT